MKEEVDPKQADGTEWSRVNRGEFTFPCGLMQVEGMMIKRPCKVERVDMWPCTPLLYLKGRRWCMFTYLYDKTEEPSVCLLVHQILVPH